MTIVTMPVPVRRKFLSFEERYTVDERFKMIEDQTLAVARGSVNCAIFTGGQGIGKTQTVLNALEGAGWSDAATFEGEDTDITKLYTYVKGYCSAKGLFLKLAENTSGLLIFDDCDSVFTKHDAFEIIKAATDDKKHRRITWQIQSNAETAFLFNGGVILISNTEDLRRKMPSRGLGVNLKLSRDEVMTRMEKIAFFKGYMPGVPDEVKQECLDFIKIQILDGNLKFDLRLLRIAIQLRLDCPETWQAFVLSKMYLK